MVTRSGGFTLSVPSSLWHSVCPSHLLPGVTSHRSHLHTHCAHACMRANTHTRTHTPGIGRVWNHKRCLGGGKGEDGKVSLIGIMRVEIKLRYIKIE